MAITQTEVDKIAKLAHLAIHQADKPKYIQELSNILDLVEQMNAVDTDNVEPLAHPLETTQRLRPDEVTETDQRDYFQKIAPQVEAGLYLVPQVIEEEG